MGLKKGRITNKVSTESTTLDEYVKNNNISNIDLIKLDTEGAEYQILLGAEETINKYKPIIICETLFNKIETELDLIMRKHDYGFYNHNNKGLINVKTIVRNQDDGVRNCFFVPKEKVHLIEEWIV